MAGRSRMTAAGRGREAPSGHGETSGDLEFLPGCRHSWEPLRAQALARYLPAFAVLRGTWKVPGEGRSTDDTTRTNNCGAEAHDRRRFFGCRRAPEPGQTSRSVVATH